MDRKVAIPTKNEKVDSHFGHCDYYTIYSLDKNDRVNNKEHFEAPKGCGCKSNIASVLRSMNVDTLLAGNMGNGAINKLSAAGIKVYRGCNGEVDKLINDYLNGKINDSGLTCENHSTNEHGYGHNCNH